jgi:uncharacterized protein YbjT (DUF2867 family)
MKPSPYVVTGATSRTGSVVANALLDAGLPVRVLGRSLDRLKPLAERGAEPLAVDPLDSRGLRRALAGAEAAYVMLQPNYIPDSPDFRGFQDRVVDALGAALDGSGVRRAVTLSSWGADKPSGNGPVAGLHHLEKRMEQVEGLSVVHLRAGYFMENTLGQIGVIHARGVAASPFRPEVEMPMVATRDIGAAAARLLMDGEFTGHAAREFQGQRDLSMAGATAVIGRSLGRPELAYEQDCLDRFRAELAAAGCAPNVVELMVEVVEAINSGWIRTLEPRSEDNTTPTSFEAFVQGQWLPRYGAQ